MTQIQDYSEQNSLYRIKSQPGTLQLLLITILVTMVFLGVAALPENSPTWRILPVLAALVAFEGAWTTRWISRASRRVNRLFYRLAEIVVIIAVITIAYWLAMDKITRVNLFDNIDDAPLSVFNIQIIILICLCLTAWAWSNHLAGIFLKLAMSEYEVIFYTMPSAERQQKGIALVTPIYRNQLFHNYIQNWAIGGLLLALFAMLTTFELTSRNLAAIQNFDFPNVTRLGLPSALLIALIIYFVAGFWLASHARMAVMQARWIAGGLQIEPALMTRWRRHVLLIILLIAGLAAFLPIGSTLAISKIIQAVLGFFFAFITILLSLIPILLGWILSLFSGEVSDQEQLPLDVSPLPPGGETPEPIFELPANVLEGIFIFTATLVAIIALVYFLRFRSVHIDFTRLKVSWRRLIARLDAYWRRFRSGSVELAKAVRIRIRRPIFPGAEVMAPWRLLPVRAQTPRDQIRHYYLFLQRAEKQGVVRKPGQTPLEYEIILLENWPEQSEDIIDLTNMFLQARYSQKLITAQASDQAKGVFKRLRTAFRGNPSTNPMVTGSE